MSDVEMKVRLADGRVLRVTAEVDDRGLLTAIERAKQAVAGFIVEELRKVLGDDTEDGERVREADIGANLPAGFVDRLDTENTDA